jgi:hypothetical protein
MLRIDLGCDRLQHYFIMKRRWGKLDSTFCGDGLEKEFRPGQGHISPSFFNLAPFSWPESTGHENGEVAY